MKRRKRVSAHRKMAGRKIDGRKIARPRASAGARTRPLALMPEWPGCYRPIKKPVTLRLDADVLAWFRRQGRGDQTRINRALRKSMTDERKSVGE